MPWCLSLKMSVKGKDQRRNDTQRNPTLERPMCLKSAPSQEPRLWHLIILHGAMLTSWSAPIPHTMCTVCKSMGKGKRLNATFKKISAVGEGNEQNTTYL